MADTKVSGLSAATLPLDGTEVIPIVQGGTSKKLPLAAAGGSWICKALSADDAKTATAAAKVTGLDLALPIGTYQFQYFIRYQTAATTTGISFGLNYSGTVTSFVWNQRWVDVSATAATAAPDQDEVLATGGVMGAFASRAKTTSARGVTISVDTASADMLMIIEGLMVVTVAGNLELWAGTEVAASAATVKSGSSVAALRVG